MRRPLCGRSDVHSRRHEAAVTRTGQSQRQSNVPHAKLCGQGLRAEAVRRDACHVRAAGRGARGCRAACRPPKLHCARRLGRRAEVGPHQLQREVGRRLTRVPYSAIPDRHLRTCASSTLTSASYGCWLTTVRHKADTSDRSSCGSCCGDRVQVTREEYLCKVGTRIRSLLASHGTQGYHLFRIRQRR